jgi:hypothetical protein
MSLFHRDQNTVPKAFKTPTLTTDKLTYLFKVVMFCDNV